MNGFMCEADPANYSPAVGDDDINDGGDGVWAGKSGDYHDQHSSLEDVDLIDLERNQAFWEMLTRPACSTIEVSGRQGPMSSGVVPGTYG
jgi:hypothetical protein